MDKYTIISNWKKIGIYRSVYEKESIAARKMSQKGG